MSVAESTALCLTGLILHEFMFNLPEFRVQVPAEHQNTETHSGRHLRGKQ